MEKACNRCVNLNKSVNIDAIRLFSNYIPYKIIRMIGESECCVFDKKIVHQKGSIVYFDIIGFTSIVVNYLNLNSDIADLSETLSEYYSVVTETIREFSGSIFQFAGDSILISFEEFEDEKPEENVKRALTAIFRILELSNNYNSVSLETNGFMLKPKIGFSYGEYNQVILGSTDLFLTPVLVGRAVKNAISCEKECKQQSLVIDDKTFQIVKNCGLEQSFKPLTESAYIFTQIPSSFFDDIKYPDFYDTEPLFEKPYFYGRLISFINPTIRKQIENSLNGFSGEYKDISCLMIKFDGNFVNELVDGMNDDILKVLNFLYTTVCEKSGKYGGYCMKPDFSDKGIVFPVVFGIPSAMENKERNALFCSAEIMRDCLNHKEIKKVHIGLVTGMVYAGEFGGILRKDYTIIGNSINFASRLMMSAKENENFSLIMDYRTNAFVQKFCKTSIITGISCKGYKGLQTAYRFKSFKMLSKSIESKGKLLVRTEELSYLLEFYDKMNDSKMQFVGIKGEAGIGKSFFVDSFKNALKQKDKEAYIYSGYCYQYEQSTPFFCWQSIIRQIIQLSSGITLDIAEILVKSFFYEHFPEDLYWFPTFMNIFGYNFQEPIEIVNMDVSQKQEHLFKLLYKILLLFKKTNTVVIIDSLQWCDDVSLNMLKYLHNHQSEANLLILFTVRDSDSLQDFFNENNFDFIELKQLSDDKSVELTKSLLNMKEVDEDFVHKIVSNASGNPFFIENIIQGFIEKGILIEDENGYFNLSDKKQVFQIPTSVQDIVLSRFDSLKFFNQVVCRTASAIGKEFYKDCLIELLPDGFDETKVEKSLTDLQKHNLIIKDENNDDEYLFSNGITRDLIYETILDITKKELNLKILEFFEKKYKDDYSLIVEKLEYYAQESKEQKKIVKYALESAVRAKNKSSLLDVISHYWIAIEAWEQIEEEKDFNQFFQMQLDLADVYRLKGDYNESENVYNLVIQASESSKIQIEANCGLEKCTQERESAVGS